MGSHLKSNRKLEEQSIAGDNAVAGLPGLSGLSMDWGSNLQRIQQIFGNGSQGQTAAPKGAVSGSSSTDKKAEATTPKGLDAPMIDQHEFDHWNRGAFCGLATMAMMLQANGKNAGTSTADLNQYASAMYNKNAGGTSGRAMAAYLRKEGLKDSSFTTRGTTSRLVQSLQSGQTVPLGVVHTAGEVTKLEGGKSARYPNLKVGDRHFHKFQGSGHWLLVTRFEGKPEKPTSFYVNDPDLGGELRCTMAELDAMAAGSGQYWMVEQR